MCSLSTSGREITSIINLNLNTSSYLKYNILIHTRRENMTKKKTTQEFAEEIKQKWNLEVIGEYQGAKSLIEFCCHNGHQNSAVATNLLTRGYTCKECQTGYKVTPRTEWTSEKLNHLKELYATGIAVDAIAQTLETTRAAVYKAVSDHKYERSLFYHQFSSIEKTILEQGRELLTPLDVTTTTLSRLRVRCAQGHLVDQLAGNILYKNSGCNLCANPRSQGEQELLEYIQSLYQGWIIENDRTILEGQELDIVLPDLGLAFEYNGAYWHSSDKKHKHYHQQKTKSVEEFGYQLIHIHEYQWQYNQPIVKQKIQHLLQPQPRIGARKTRVQQVTWQEAKGFLETTHIQGAGAPTGYNFGLYYQDKLVALITFAKPRFNHNYDLELVRYSTSQPVQGGCSRLLAHAQKTLQFRSLVTYALQDWSQGNLYRTLGFELQGLTEPNYSYYRGSQRITRYQAQKHRLPKLLEQYDSQLTEVENMLANGYHQVFDSGNQVWAKWY
jgi:hypothetical protein